MKDSGTTENIQKEGVLMLGNEKNNVENDLSRSERKDFIKAMTIDKSEKTSEQERISTLSFLENNNQTREEVIDPIKNLADNAGNDASFVNASLNTTINPPANVANKVNYPPDVQGDKIIAMTIGKNEKTSEQEPITALIFSEDNNQSTEEVIDPIENLSDNEDNDASFVNASLNTTINPPVNMTKNDNYAPDVQNNNLTPDWNAFSPITEDTILTIQKLRHQNHNNYTNSGESENNHNRCTSLDAVEYLIFQKKFICLDGIMRYFNGTYYERVDDNKADELLLDLGYQFVKRKGHYMYLNDMARFLKVHPEIRKANSKEGEERYLAFKNCVLDLETNKTYKNNGEFIVTSYIDCEYFDFPFLQSTPNWNKYSSSVTGGDKKLENLIMEVLGYYITSDMSAQKFVVLWGPGGTGKSVFGNFLRSLFNTDAISSIPLQKLGDKFSNSSIVGKKLNISMDLPGGKINNESIAMLKLLTGNDLCVAEAKYKTPVSFVNTCKFIFSTNLMVTPETDDSGFRRRIITLPFIYQVPDELKDPHLVEKLLEEKQLIVFNALQYYRGLKNRNYKFTDIDYEFYINSVNNMTGLSAVRYDMNDVVLEFVEQCCVFDCESKIHIRDLYFAYKNYCALNCKEAFETQSGFTTALKKVTSNEKGIEFKKIRIENESLSGVKGLALKQT